MGTLIKDHLTSDLVLLLHTMPFKPILRLLGGKIQNELLKVAQDNEFYGMTVDDESISFHLLSRPNIKVRVLIATYLENFKYMTKDKHVSKRAIYKHLQAIDHCDFFDRFMRNTDCTKMVMLFKDLQRRFKILQLISPWEVIVLCHYATFWNIDRVKLPYYVAYLRIFRLISAGLLMPYSYGIEDPLVRGERIGRNLTMIARERITHLIQSLLRLSMYRDGIRYIFGWTDSLDKYDFHEGTFIPMPSIYPDIDLDESNTLTKDPQPELRDLPFWKLRPEKESEHYDPSLEYVSMKKVARANISAIQKIPIKKPLKRRFYSIRYLKDSYYENCKMRGSRHYRNFKNLRESLYTMCFVDDPCNPNKRQVFSRPTPQMEELDYSDWVADWEYIMECSPKSVAALYGIFAEMSMIDLLLLKRIRNTRNDDVLQAALKRRRRIRDIDEEDKRWDPFLNLKDLDRVMSTKNLYMPNQPDTWSIGQLRPRWLTFDELLKYNKLMQKAATLVTGSPLLLQQNWKWPKDAPVDDIVEKFAELYTERLEKLTKKRQEAIKKGLPVDDPTPAEAEQIQKQKEEAEARRARCKKMFNDLKIFCPKHEGFAGMKIKRVGDTISFEYTHQNPNRAAVAKDESDSDSAEVEGKGVYEHVDKTGNRDPAMLGDPMSEETYPALDDFIVRRLSCDNGLSVEETKNMIKKFQKKKPILNYLTSEIIGRKIKANRKPIKKIGTIHHDPEKLLRHYGYDFNRERQEDKKKLALMRREQEQAEKRKAESSMHRGYTEQDQYNSNIDWYNSQQRFYQNYIKERPNPDNRPPQPSQSTFTPSPYLRSIFRPGAAPRWDGTKFVSKTFEHEQGASKNLPNSSKGLPKAGQKPTEPPTRVPTSDESSVTTFGLNAYSTEQHYYPMHSHLYSTPTNPFYIPQNPFASYYFPFTVPATIPWDGMPSVPSTASMRSSLSTSNTVTTASLTNPTVSTLSSIVPTSSFNSLGLIPGWNPLMSTTSSIMQSLVPPPPPPPPPPSMTPPPPPPSTSPPTAAKSPASYPSSQSPAPPTD